MKNGDVPWISAAGRVRSAAGGGTFRGGSTHPAAGEVPLAAGAALPGGRLLFRWEMGLSENIMGNHFIELDIIWDSVMG